MFLVTNKNMGLCLYMARFNGSFLSYCTRPEDTKWAFSLSSAWSHPQLALSLRFIQTGFQTSFQNLNIGWCIGQHTWLPLWKTHAQFPTQTKNHIFSSFSLFPVTGLHMQLGAEGCIHQFSKLSSLHVWHSIRLQQIQQMLNQQTIFFQLISEFQKCRKFSQSNCSLHKQSVRSLQIV